MTSFIRERSVGACSFQTVKMVKYSSISKDHLKMEDSFKHPSSVTPQKKPLSAMLYRSMFALWWQPLCWQSFISQLVQTLVVVSWCVATSMPPELCSIVPKTSRRIVNVHLSESAPALDHLKVYGWLTVGFKTLTEFAFHLAIWSVISFLDQFALHGGSCHHGLEAPLAFLNILLWMKNYNINLGHIEHPQRHRST